MVSSVIGFVFAHRNASAELLDFGLEHRLRSAPLSGAGGERDHAGHRQPMPAFHRGVAHVAELRLLPGRLAVKSAVGIGRARMRVVFALLPMEVGPPSSSPLASLGRKLFCEAKASLSVPSTEKCSSYNSGFAFGWFKSLGHELGEYLSFSSTG